MPSGAPAHKDEADALLADLEQKGVLGRLKCDKTTDNHFRGHFVLKPGGKGVWLVTDYTPIPVDVNRLPECWERLRVVD